MKNSSFKQEPKQLKIDTSSLSEAMLTNVPSPMADQHFKNVAVKQSQKAAKLLCRKLDEKFKGEVLEIQSNNKDKEVSDFTNACNLFECIVTQ